MSGMAPSMSLQASAKHGYETVPTLPAYTATPAPEAWLAMAEASHTGAASLQDQTGATYTG